MALSRAVSCLLGAAFLNSMTPPHPSEPSPTWSDRTHLVVGSVFLLSATGLGVHGKGLNERDRRSSA